VSEDFAEDGDAAACLDLLLERVTHDANAHIGLLYLPVPERHALQMTAVIGAPRRLAWPWVRLAQAAPAPVPEAVRSQSPVWICDQQEFARRFPRAALAFPYSVAHYAVPLMADGVCWGALNLLWPGSRPEGLSTTEQTLIGVTTDRMAEALRDSAARRRPVRPREEPLILEPGPPQAEPAAALLERFIDGFVALDPHGRVTSLTDRAARLLGRGQGALLDAELWDELAWLSDPAYENAFVSALFSRQPTSFDACRSDGVWLSFHLHPDTTGVSVRIVRRDAPERERELAEDSLPTAPARAGTLFHLLHLASALTEAAGISEVAESIMDQMRPVLDAEGLALMVADEGRVRVVAARGFPPELPEYFDDLPMAAQTEGIRSMETGVAGFHPTNAELVHTFPQHQVYRGMAAFAFLPLTVSSGTFGSLVLGYDKPHPFTPDERAELTALAGMIAQALERARLHDANVQVARGLQRGLLPRHLPPVPGLEVVARYLPAKHTQEVGGDFYDLIDFGAHGAAAVIGDVQGHNVQAAALMGQIRTTVHSHARAGASPEEVLAHTNQLLLELKSDLFCSCLYVRLDVSAQRAFLASAGHPPPILRHSTHHAEVLDLPPGLLLGVEEEPRFQTVEVPLPPGAVLALYTDGLVERPNVDLGQSIDLLADQLAEAEDESLDMLADTIVKRAQETAVPQNSDDIALLLIQHGTRGHTH
jgi:serine phosphatase RsbU (regulator of sigma subunit)/PAS domain-containing protein